MFPFFSYSSLPPVLPTGESPPFHHFVVRYIPVMCYCQCHLFSLLPSSSVRQDPPQRIPISRKSDMNTLDISDVNPCPPLHRALPCLVLFTSLAISVIPASRPPATRDLEVHLTRSLSSHHPPNPALAIHVPLSSIYSFLPLLNPTPGLLSSSHRCHWHLYIHPCNALTSTLTGIFFPPLLRFPSPFPSQPPINLPLASPDSWSPISNDLSALILHLAPGNLAPAFDRDVSNSRPHKDAHLHLLLFSLYLRLPPKAYRSLPELSHPFPANSAWPCEPPNDPSKTRTASTVLPPPIPSTIPRYLSPSPRYGTCAPPFVPRRLLVSLSRVFAVRSSQFAVGISKHWR